MRYSDDIIEEVISRNDIVDVIGESVHLKRSGSNYTGLCPFHNEKTPSFSVSRNKQMYYCFGCHAGGNVITFVMEYNNYTFVEALQHLAERGGVTLPEADESEAAQREADKKSLLLEINKKAAQFYYYRLKSKQGEKGLEYFHGRGLTDETIRLFGLGYSDAYGNTLYTYLKKQGYSDDVLQETGLFLFDEKRGVSDKFWNRVMYPILDARSRVIGFGGRVMGDGKPKYLNSPETYLFNKRRNLYALNYARRTRENYFILCEGYMDVITMHQAGFTNTVASLGTALTPEQCSLIRRFKNEVLLVYDSDEAGRNAALRAIPLLKEAGISAKVVNLLPHKDPDEFIKAEGIEAMKARLDEAENGFVFEIERLSLQYDLSDPDDKTRFQRDVAGRLLQFTEELERENYLDAVSRRFSIPKDGLKKLIRSLAMSGTPAESYNRPQSASSRQKTETDAGGIVTSQKLLLTYLAGYPEAYAQTAGLIGPSDFLDPLCKRVAEGLYAQLKTGSVSEAKLIGMFEDAETQSAAAGIFHTTIPVDGQNELDRAFTDTVIRIMSASNEEKMKTIDLTDMKAFQKLISGKKQLEEFRSGSRKLHLTMK